MVRGRDVLVLMRGRRPRRTTRRYATSLLWRRALCLLGLVLGRLWRLWRNSAFRDSDAGVRRSRSTTRGGVIVRVGPDGRARAFVIVNWTPDALVQRIHVEVRKICIVVGGEMEEVV